MKLPAFEYACPATLAEAVALLASRDEAKALAGGQSLVPMMAFRIASPSLLVDLRKLSDLRQITIDDSGVRLGTRGKQQTRRRRPGPPPPYGAARNGPGVGTPKPRFRQVRRSGSGRGGANRCREARCAQVWWGAGFPPDHAR